MGPGNRAAGIPDGRCSLSCSRLAWGGGCLEGRAHRPDGSGWLGWRMVTGSTVTLHRSGSPGTFHSGSRTALSGAQSLPHGPGQLEKGCHHPALHTTGLRGRGAPPTALEPLVSRERGQGKETAHGPGPVLSGSGTRPRPAPRARGRGTAATRVPTGQKRSRSLCGCTRACRDRTLAGWDRRGPRQPAREPAQGPAPSLPVFPGTDRQTDRRSLPQADGTMSPAPPNDP